MSRSSPITKKILAWYAVHGRSLPWRGTRDPYAIWVSEVMLQQTRVETVIPYYSRFLAVFPTLETLAGAVLEEVLKVWENMGYYSRARNLHRAAGIISTEMGGRPPETLDEWLRLPGIGTYTGSAIMSFAFGKCSIAVDGNLRRVLCRLFAVETRPEDAQTGERIRELAESILPAGDSSSLNQALMDLGAMICTPRSPACKDCPLREDCLAFRRNIQDRLPLRRKRSPLPHREMTAALIRDREGRFLVAQRAAQGLLGGLWKFPGGERRETETLSEATARTVQEEVGVKVKIGEKMGVIEHAFTHFRMSLHVFPCLKERGSPRALGCAGWRWAGARTLSALPFSKADRTIMDTLLPGKNNAGSGKTRAAGC